MSEQPESRVHMRTTPQPQIQHPPVEGQQLAAGFGFRRPASGEGQPALDVPWQAALPGHKVDLTGATTGQPPPGYQPPQPAVEPQPQQPAPQPTQPPLAPPQQAPWPVQHPTQFGSNGVQHAPRPQAQAQAQAQAQTPVPTQPQPQEPQPQPQELVVDIVSLLGAPFEDRQAETFRMLVKACGREGISLWEVHETLLTLFGGDR